MNTSDGFGLRSDLRSGAATRTSAAESDAESSSSLPPLNPEFPYTMTPFRPEFFDYPPIPTPASAASDTTP